MFFIFVFPNASTSWRLDDPGETAAPRASWSVEIVNDSPGGMPFVCKLTRPERTQAASPIGLSDWGPVSPALVTPGPGTSQVGTASTLQSPPKLFPLAAVGCLLGLWNAVSAGCVLICWAFGCLIVNHAVYNGALWVTQYRFYLLTRLDIKVISLTSERGWRLEVSHTAKCD